MNAPEEWDEVQDMKKIMIKFIISLICILSIFSNVITYADDSYTNDRNENVQFEEFIEEIDKNKDKFSMESLMEQYNSLKTTKVEVEVVKQNQDTSSNIEKIKIVSINFINYIFVFMKKNIVYIVILLVLFTISIVIKKKGGA